MKQIIVNKYNQRKSDALSSSTTLLVGMETKNPLPTNVNDGGGVSAADMMGLTWIFSGDDYF